MLECLQEAFMVHPTTRLQENCGPRSSASQEIRIHLLSSDYKHWRDGLPSSINKADESHMTPSFPSDLRGNRLSTLANNLHRLHHSGQATLIHVVDSVGCELIHLHSFRINAEEGFNVCTIESYGSGN